MPLTANASNPARMKDTGFGDARSVLTNMRIEGVLSKDEALDLDVDFAEEWLKLQDSAGNMSPDNKIQYEKNVRNILKDKIEAKGYDSIIYNNDVEDIGSDSMVILRPNQLRSRFAAFNPLKRKSSDLLAGVGASSLLSDYKYQDEDETIWTMTGDGKQY